MAKQKITGSQIGLIRTVDANGWNVIIDADGKKIYTKSGTVTGVSLPAGLSFANGITTAMPVGLNGTNLYSASYIITDSLILDGASRQIMPHTIFDTGTGTNISYGVVNIYTGGAWSGTLLYKYRIEEV